MRALDKERYVPSLPPVSAQVLAQFTEALQGKRLCLLTGAGVSTESGIPDYRGEETARRARNPIQFKQFVEDEAGRRRYWARAMIGWTHFREAMPNRAHRAAARLEAQGLLTGIVTQNVDRLHQRAGAKKVVELHGALEEVICLSCRRTEHRDDLQERLRLLNPDFLQLSAAMAPDGDSDLDETAVRRFVPADCLHCGGLLKPYVVFFGEGVESQTVEDAWRLYEGSDALLIAGSSLTVFSGFRFARRAAQDDKPIYLINVGTTRADHLAAARIEANVGATLEHVAKTLAQ